MNVSKSILTGVFGLGILLGSTGVSLLNGGKEDEEASVRSKTKSERKNKKQKQSSGNYASLSPQEASGQFAGWINSGTEFENLSGLISRAAEWSAESTMEQAMQIEDPYKRREVLQQLFRYWIGSDQEEALSTIKAIANVALQRDLYRDAMRWLSSADPQAAIKLLQANNNLHDEDLWNRSFANWARKDRDGAIAAVLKIEHEGMRHEVLESVAQRMADVDLAKALEWAGTLKDVEAQVALAGVLQEAANSNPQIVVANLENIPEGRVRNELISRTADEWAERDPDGAMKWAETLNEDERERAIGEIAESVFETDPDRAQEIADLIPGTEQRSELIQRIARLRATADVDDAMQWLGTLPAEDRAGAWSGVAREWAQTDPQAAAEFGATMEDPVAQEQLVSAASYTWSQRAPAQAAEWARTLEGRNQTNAMNRIVENWARENPADAGDFVASSLDGELQASMTRQVVSRWLRNDTNEASVWIDSLPSGSGRDSAVSTLVSNIEREYPETALQWANTIGDERRREYMLRRINKRLEQE